MADEVDYYGELWAAVHEQARLLQALRLIEGVKCLPRGKQARQGDALVLVRELLELNQMEVSRRTLLYERSVLAKAGGAIPCT